MIENQNPLPNRVKEIVTHLISFESRAQGTVKMKFNTLLIPLIRTELKAMGHSKPFFTTEAQFMIRTILHNEAVLMRFLPSCVLAGPKNEKEQFRLWSGKGIYIGVAGALAMFDFTREWNRNTLLVFDITPFFSEISHLLQAP